MNIYIYYTYATVRPVWGLNQGRADFYVFLSTGDPINELSANYDREKRPLLVASGRGDGGDSGGENVWFLAWKGPRVFLAENGVVSSREVQKGLVSGMEIGGPRFQQRNVWFLA